MKPIDGITNAETTELLRLLRKLMDLRNDGGFLFSEDRESAGLSRTISTLQMYMNHAGGIEGYLDELIAERRREEELDAQAR